MKAGIIVLNQSTPDILFLSFLSNQENRAFDILQGKIYGEGRQLFVYPIKAKGPEVVLEAQTPVG